VLVVVKLGNAPVPVLTLALVRMELVVALVMSRPESVVPALNVLVARGSARVLRMAVVA
jgi:hypothetical protein